MEKIIFNKKQLRLNEDNNNSEGTAYVEPSSNNLNSLSTDLNKTKQQNPTDNTFIVNAKSYDGNETNNPISLDINAKNPTDAAKQFQELKMKPQYKSLMSKSDSDVNIRFRIQSEQIERLKESCVSFSKKELNEMLKK